MNQSIKSPHQLIHHLISNTDRIKSYFLRMPHQKRWSVMENSIKQASQELIKDKPIVWLLHDKTSAGLSHDLLAIHQPNKENTQDNTAFIEIPDDPENGGSKNGRFPTVLHAIDLIVGSVQKVRQMGVMIPYPHLHLGKRERLIRVIQNLNQLPFFVSVSLEINPFMTNAVIIHRNKRRIDAEVILHAYYGMLQIENGLVEDLWRHTMLKLAPKESDLSHYIGWVGVVNHEILKTMRNMDLQRIKNIDTVFNLKINPLSAQSLIDEKINNSDLKKAYSAAEHRLWKFTIN